MSRRILDETTKSTVASDDYLYMDGQTDGASKITPDNLVRNTTVAQQLAQHIADAEDEVEQITDDIEGIRSDISDVKADIEELKQGGTGSGVPSAVRSAILALFESAAYAETGLTDEIAIVESWAEAITEITLNNSTISISGASTSQLVATTVPSGGTVTWSSSDVSIATVSSTGLVTGVGNGTATITASCGGLSARCTATVSGFAELVSISAVYSGGTVYDTASLDDLKADLVVTGTYDDSSTATITTYTLSGTLTVGTSTITVVYGGKTTTFNVTVTEITVPDGYTEYDYLMSSASGWGVGYDMYINTGITFTGDIVKMTVDCQRNSNSSGVGAAMSLKQTGTNETENANGLIVGYTNNTDLYTWGGSGNAVTYTSDTSSRHRLVATRTSSSLTFSVDGVNVGTAPDAPRAVGEYPLTLFSAKHVTKDADGTPYAFNGKIYYAEIEVDGVVLGKFYPCVRNSDNAVGVYNTVNKTFTTYYANKSTSKITAGNDE